MGAAAGAHRKFRISFESSYPAESSRTVSPMRTSSRSLVSGPPFAPRRGARQNPPPGHGRNSNSRGSLLRRPQRTQEQERAITALFRASALLDPIRLTIWDRENLTVTQLRLLGHLAEQEGLSNAELAERLYVTRPSVSALLERLERGGFIRREVSTHDRRSIRIWLQPRGKAVVESLREELRDYAAGLMESMSPAEFLEFARSVERFVESGSQRRRRDLQLEDPGD
ncbi:MAG: hypothetical protein C4321_02960 [Chloroflexota bacterium]